MGPATVAGHPKRDLAKNRTPHGTRDIAVQFPCQGYHTRMGAAGEWATTPFYRLGAGVRPVSRVACPGVRDCSTGLWVICGARPSLARLGTRAFARSSALAASQHVTVNF